MLSLPTGIPWYFCRGHLQMATNAFQYYTEAEIGACGRMRACYACTCLQVEIGAIGVHAPTHTKPACHVHAWQHAHVQARTPTLVPAGFLATALRQSTLPMQLPPLSGDRSDDEVRGGRARAGASNPYA